MSGLLEGDHLRNLKNSLEVEALSIIVFSMFLLMALVIS